LQVDFNSYNAAALSSSEKSVGTRYVYRFIVDSVVGVQFPQNGDSLWLNGAAGAKDIAGNMQANAVNRKVVLRVNRLAIVPNIVKTIVKNPFTPPTESFLLKFYATIPRMAVFGNITLAASGKVYDVLGNCVHTWNDTSLTISSSHGLLHGNDKDLTIRWNGRDQNGRLVGSGVYQAIFSFRQKNGQDISVLEDQRIKIGVKR
ncbi:MAG TPA: hypothetical protein VF335_02580, partial [Chitinivibrionales bacterium]